MNEAMQIIADAVRGLPLGDRMKLLANLMAEVAEESRGGVMSWLVGNAETRIAVGVGLGPLADRFHDLITQLAVTQGRSMDVDHPQSMEAVVKGWKASLGEGAR